MDNYNNYYYSDSNNSQDYNNNYYNHYNMNISIDDRNINNTSSDNKLIDPYQGFIKGNMFKDLYDKYKNYNVQEPKPENERERMLLELQTYYFALIDLDLYLDTFPTDTNIVKKYSELLTIVTQLTNNFEQKYGPLTLTSPSLNNNSWAWINSPWPWEVTS